MRQINRLTATQVEALIKDPPAKAGYTPDGGGLLLQRSPAGSASWIYRYKLHGREHFVGLGSARIVTLAAARRKADEYRRLREHGIDPLSEKVGARSKAQRDSDQRITVADAAEAYIKLHETGWSAGNAASWRDTMRLHITPRIGRLDVSDIDTTAVLRVVEPLWTKKLATAALVRSRLEAVLGWSITSGRREGPNPARLAGHLENLLPRTGQKSGNRPALPWQEMPGFMTRLRALPGIAARAVEFITLTGARLEEVTEARWGEVDLKARIWTVPAERMKMKAIHEVPMSTQMIALLKALPGEHQPGDLIFPSERKGTPIAGSVANDVLRKLGYARGEVCIHGSRSSLRTWLADNTQAPKDVREACIAHDERGRDVAAYERTRFLAQRKPLMDQWARFLGGDNNVVPLNRSKSKAAA